MQFLDDSLLPENQQPLVIQVAPYGPEFLPGDSDDIPVTMAEQVQKAVDCWNAGATVLHSVAGFTGRSRVKTSGLVDAGGKLPLVLTFIDTDEHVSRVMPKLREMASHRLIVSENVTIEQGSL